MEQGPLGDRQRPKFLESSSGNGLGPFQESDHTNKEPADDSDDYYADSANQDPVSSSNGAHVEEKSGDISGGDGIGEDPTSDEELDVHGGQGDNGELVDDKGPGNTLDVKGVEPGPNCDSIISELQTLWDRHIAASNNAWIHILMRDHQSNMKKTFLGRRLDKNSAAYVHINDKLEVVKFIVAIDVPPVQFRTSAFKSSHGKG
ncbi:hypothetical protein BASA61_005531, partial [Batrachochytrium salamandrivorans]